MGLCVDRGAYSVTRVSIPTCRRGPRPQIRALVARLRVAGCLLAACIVPPSVLSQAPPGASDPAPALGPLPGAQGSAPELSADEPILYDAETRTLVARGNAVLKDPRGIIEADVIRYDEAGAQMSAEGNVRLTQPGLRILARRMSYDLRRGFYEGEDFRAGLPPVYIVGKRFSGTRLRLDVEDIRVYYGEPAQTSLSLRADRAVLYPGERIIGDQLRLSIAGTPIPLPSREQALGGGVSLDYRGSVGFRENLGFYLRNEFLVPFGDWGNWGGNLDVYTRRGLLVGPAWANRWEDDAGAGSARITAGWLSDGSDLGEKDTRNTDFPQHRSFVEGSFEERHEQLRVHGQFSLLSDSEVERDFRNYYFDDAEQPDTFTQFTYQGSGWILTALARYAFNDFYNQVERLPELAFTVPWKRVFTLPLYVQGQARYSRYRQSFLEPRAALRIEEDFDADGALTDTRYVFTEGGQRIESATALPAFPVGSRAEALDAGFRVETETTQTNGATARSTLLEIDRLARGPWVDRLDAHLALQSPYTLARWLTLTPRAVVRGLHYDRSAAEGATAPDNTATEVFAASTPDTLDRVATELGADLRGVFHRQWDVSPGNVWGIDGLRHLVMPQIGYRWRSVSQQGDSALPYDRALYPARWLPQLDLADTRAVDTLTDGQVLRLGLENSLWVRRGDVWERWLELHLYQDAHPGAGGSATAQQPLLLDGVTPADASTFWRHSYAELRWNATPWFTLYWEHQLETEALTSRAYRAGFTVQGADRWTFSAGVHSLDAVLREYAARLFYQLHPDWSVQGEWIYDARGSRFTEQRYSVERRLAKTWAIGFFMRFNQGSQREESVNLGLRLNLRS